MIDIERDVLIRETARGLTRRNALSDSPSLLTCQGIGPHKIFRGARRQPQSGQGLTATCLEQDRSMRNPNLHGRHCGSEHHRTSFGQPSSGLRSFVEQEEKYVPASQMWERFLGPIGISVVNENEVLQWSEVCWYSDIEGLLYGKLYAPTVMLHNPISALLGQ